MIIILKQHANPAKVEELKQELNAAGIAYGEVEQGIVVETPAAAVISDLLAKEVDFFSIGTNDLTQYIMAADRGNPRISHLYRPDSEAVTKAIRTVIEAGRKAGIEVSMCGEYAADLSATDLLISLGLRKFSVSAPAIKRLKTR